jgi:azurin
MAPEDADKVIAATKMLGPGETDTVSFTAPAAGTYDYICTFPGHAMAGMRGVLTVK